jgi:hypothetical protein
MGIFATLADPKNTWENVTLPISEAFPFGTPLLRPALDSRVGLVSSANRVGWASEVMVPHAQASQWHARQEATSGIGQTPAKPDAAGTMVPTVHSETNEVEPGRRPKPIPVRRGRA